MRVNGRTVTTSDPARRLLDFLRDDLELTGAKEGCGMGECGACTVLIDGDPVCACLVLVGQIAETDVVTIEGIGDDDRLHPVQEALVSHFASQCGFCTPGVVVSVAGLLAKNPGPAETDVREALEGNLCRCTGYQAIFRAVASLAE